MSEEENPQQDPKGLSVKKVSKKKIIFVGLDEELTTVFDRVSVLPYKEVYLVLPKRAVLLQSIVNLKILKQKFEDIEKSLFLITNDPNGMKLAHQAEIKVFDQWADEDHAKSNKNPNDASSLLKPIAAASNEVGDELPSRLPQKKASIFEVVRELRGNDGKSFSFRHFFRDRRKKFHEQGGLQVMLSGGSRRFLSTLLASSIALFLIISYTVLPGVSIYIEPASSVLTKGTNIVLEPNPSSPRSLKAYPVEASTELTLSYNASGVINEGSSARGQITIYNTSNTDQPLIQQTRFQTSDGLVFRLQKDAIVPRGTPENPGTVVAEVVADTLDANGVAIGTRGNIEPTRFFLPGLKEDSRENVYAENTAAFTGGESQVKTLVLEEDLKAAQIKLEEQLKEKALSSLRKEALSLGTAQSLSLKLLEDSDVLSYGTATIRLPYELIGQELETFEITGTLDISGVAYDEEALNAILKTEIVNGGTPGKQLVKINEDSVSIHVIEINKTSNEYKFTAEIQGIEEYEIDPSLEGGSVLAQKIKQHIAGKSIVEAQQYIQNLPEVNQVEIKRWPRWSPTIPSLEDNIRIRSLSEGEAIVLE
jgi:hypothetical protein